MNGIGFTQMTQNNGYTNKEMLHLIRVEVQDLHKRIDYLHEKINSLCYNLST